MKKIALFGATGSIGRSTLDVVGTIDGFCVSAISGHRNLELLHQQAERFRPRWVILTDGSAAKEWNWSLPKGTELCVGMKALTEIAAETEIDIVVSAIVGRAGLESTAAAAKAGKPSCGRPWRSRPESTRRFPRECCGWRWPRQWPHRGPCYPRPR